jgi:hypothetical protein
MLSIVLIMPLITTLAFPSCLIVTIKVFSKFGAFRERFYNEVIWLQNLKTLREEKNVVQELRQCKERGHMLQCLVIYISLVLQYTMFTPGLAMFYLATILRYDHVCNEQWSRLWRSAGFSNILSAGGSTLVLGVPSLVSFYITIATAGYGQSQSSPSARRTSWRA